LSRLRGLCWCRTGTRQRRQTGDLEAQSQPAATLIGCSYACGSCPGTVTTPSWWAVTTKCTRGIRAFAYSHGAPRVSGSLSGGEERHGDHGLLHRSASATVGLRGTCGGIAVSASRISGEWENRQVPSLGVTMTTSSIQVTERDYRRLKQLLLLLSGQCYGVEPGRENLERILNLAQIVRSEAVRSNIVTMNSSVLLQFVRTGEIVKVRICFPAEADPANRKISVLSALGAALLGEPAGREFDVPLSAGKPRRIRILSVLYQPEAHGNVASEGRRERTQRPAQRSQP
jgi:regulator of nucleoside diphosphate kinase